MTSSCFQVAQMKNPGFAAVDHDDPSCVREYVAGNAASWKLLQRGFAKHKATEAVEAAVH